MARPGDATTSSAIGLRCHVFKILRPRTSGQKRCEPDRNSLHLLGQSSRRCHCQGRASNDETQYSFTHSILPSSGEDTSPIAPRDSSAFRTLREPEVFFDASAKVLNSTEDAQLKSMSIVRASDKECLVIDLEPTGKDESVAKIGKKVYPTREEAEADVKRLCK